MPEMQAADGISPPSTSAPMKNTIVVWVLGVIGLLTIMQWTAITVGKHVRIASHSLFPAALQSQHATNTFQRMSNTYGDAAVMDKEEALAFADLEAAEAVSALASAGDLIQFNSGRHQQIVSLARRVRDLQMRSKMFYAAPGNLNVVPPRQEDLADLAQENKRVQQELEALQGDLANDFRSELALIDKLVTTQAILESLLLVGVLTALFFRTRALISATVRRR